MGIQLYDPILKALPDVGILRIHDAETGYEQYIDTSSKALRRAHSQYWQERKERLKDTFQKNSVDYVSIATNEDYVKYLQQMFARR
jgi:molybdopterin-guanine dinucleotide biosynthesis protein A